MIRRSCATLDSKDLKKCTPHTYGVWAVPLRMGPAFSRSLASCRVFHGLPVAEPSKERCSGAYDKMFFLYRSAEDGHSRNKHELVRLHISTLAHAET